jgi:hypothetical protein
MGGHQAVLCGERPQSSHLKGAIIQEAGSERRLGTCMITLGILIVVAIAAVLFLLLKKR